MPGDDVFVATYARAPQLPGILLGRLGVVHGALVLGSSLLVLPEEDAHWDGTALHHAGAVHALGETFSAGGGQSTLSRLRNARTPPGWPDNGGIALVRRPAAG